MENILTSFQQILLSHYTEVDTKNAHISTSRMLLKNHSLEEKCANRLGLYKKV